MFNIFKKKKVNLDGDIDLPKPNLENLKICLGVNLLDEIEQEELDALFYVYSNFLEGKLFTDERLLEIQGDYQEGEIKPISHHFLFMDYLYYNENKKIRQPKSRMRFVSTKVNMEGLIPENGAEKNMATVNIDKFYNRVEIEKLSESFGFSVYDRCEFKKYTVWELTFKDSSHVNWVENAKTEAELRQFAL